MSASENTQRGFSVRRMAVVGCLLGVALLLRFWGIGKEAFWHDEAYSARLSDNGVAEILTENAKDVHPPLYYLGLYAWRRGLGDSDVRIRAYSTVWSLIGLLGIFLLARDIGGWRAGVIALILGAVNPLDVYFAQEARMYSQAVALCVLGAWCLWRWMALVEASPAAAPWRRWAIGYTVCAVAALYTHYLCVLVLTAQGMFVLLRFASKKRWTCAVGFLASALVVTLAFLPWYRFVLGFRDQIYRSDLTWIKMPPVSDFFSFLGREMFWGYVGAAHARWWIPTMMLPVALAGLCLWRAWRGRNAALERQERPGRIAIAYVLWLLIGPLFLVSLATVFYHAIYFRSRFSTFLLPPFLILMAVAADGFRRRWASWVATAVLGGVMLAGTCLQYQTLQKTDWRKFAEKWRRDGPPARAIFFPPLMQVPASYAVGRRLDPPGGRELQWMAHHLVGSELWICTYLGYRFNAYKGESVLYQQVRHLGSVRSSVLSRGLVVHAVTVGSHFIFNPYDERPDRVYAPIEIYGQIEAFGEPSGFYPLEFDGATTRPFRWSKPKAWFCLRKTDQAGTVVLNVQLPPRVPPFYGPVLRFHTHRGASVAGLFDTQPVVRIDDHRDGEFEVDLRIPDGAGPLWIGWTARKVNLKRADQAEDTRDLGLRLNWVGVMDGLENEKRTTDN